MAATPRNFWRYLNGPPGCLHIGDQCQRQCLLQRMRLSVLVVGPAGSQHSRCQDRIGLPFWPKLRLSECASPGGLHSLMTIGRPDGRPQSSCVKLSKDEAPDRSSACYNVLQWLEATVPRAMETYGKRLRFVNTGHRNRSFVLHLCR